jgi:hypothetical protein
VPAVLAWGHVLVHHEQGHPHPAEHREQSGRVGEARAPDPQQVQLHQADRPRQDLGGDAEGPSYQTLPTGTEPDVEFAALLARKVALFGYDQWKLRRATIKAVEYAVVCDGAYALPYFDPNVGPYTPVPNPDTGRWRWSGRARSRSRCTSATR